MSISQSRQQNRFVNHHQRVSYLSDTLQAYKTSWGLKVPGTDRGRMLSKLADLIEKNADEFAALEALNVGMYWYIHLLNMSTNRV